MLYARAVTACLLALLLLLSGCGSDHDHDHEHNGHTHSESTAQTHNGTDHHHEHAHNDEHENHEHEHENHEHEHEDHEHEHEDEGHEHEHDGHEHDDHEHEDHTHNEDEHTDHDHDHDDHADGIHLPEAEHQAIGLSVETARTTEVSETVTASATIVPVAGQQAVVAAPATGLIRADRNLNAPVPGDRVRTGQVLAVLAPTDDGSYAALKARVERLQREVERAERLYADAAIPERRLIEARHDLQVAEASLESVGGSTEDDGYDVSLRAPLDGHIQQRQLTPGTHVDTGDTLFTIVNATRVWLRAAVPAAAAAQIQDQGQHATFTVEGFDEPFTTSEIVSVGAVIDPDERTLPVVFSVDNRDERLKIGMLAEARLPVAGATTGIAIPNSAIRTEDGTPVAYVQTHTDTFERRILRTGPTDGLHTIIHAGIDDGEAVVTQGAYQVYLASVDTEAGGHHHHH